MTTRTLRASLLALTATVALALPVGASARTVIPYEFDHQIDGAKTTVEDFAGASRLAFDDAREFLYVKSGTPGVVSRVKPDGEAAPFSGVLDAQGEPVSSIAVGGESGLIDVSQIAVDNRPASTGRFFYAPEIPSPGSSRIAGFAESGTVLPGFPLPESGAGIGVAVAPDGNLWYSDGSASRLYEVDPQGKRTGRLISVGFVTPAALAIDSESNFYVENVYGFGRSVIKYSPAGKRLYSLTPQSGEPAIRDFALDQSTGNVFVSFEGKRIVEFEPNSTEPVLDIGLPEGSFEGLSEAFGVAVDSKTHDLYVTNKRSVVDVFKPKSPTVIPDVVTGVAVPRPTTALLRGTVDPDGVPATECFFRWGTSLGELNQTAPCDQATPLKGSDPIPVSATITGLTKGATYYFELVSKNASAVESHGLKESVIAQGLPLVADEYAGTLNTDSAFIFGEVTPESGKTGVQVEYGTTTSYGSLGPFPSVVLTSVTEPAKVKMQLTGLAPDTLYHYRVVATNAAGSTVSSIDHVFKTFAPDAAAPDACPNALARQQTGAALLPDCRAFELVSAAYTGGYDVESDLVPGQEPYDGFPDADGRVLYTTHNGGIPDTGSPTNNGRDPYVATRGTTGWTTSYVGIPAAGTPSPPFGSPASGADGKLDTFAFGGAQLCSPCFADGSAGVPLRRADGRLEQGMGGNLDPGPGAKADGYVAAPLSADGSHLVFGSASTFQTGGNSNGDVSLYERDLNTGATQVISKGPSGANLACLQGVGACHSPGDPNGFGELAISPDGSRVVLGQKVSEDGAGNVYWHLYMHTGGSTGTVDLTPGATLGALFDGVTSDGRAVFLTTRDRLLASDTDSSADIYEAALGTSGPASLRLVSTKFDGAPSNSDACAPATGWNTVAGAPGCDAVAFAGGAGVAASAGSFYFMTPEQLEPGAGEANQVNVYLSRPGQPPRFVALMDSTAGKPGPQEPSWSVDNPTFLGGLQQPGPMSFDYETGGFYLLEANAQSVNRYRANGGGDKYTAGPGAGTNKFKFPYRGGAEPAVDNDPTSPLRGDLFVAKPTSEGSGDSVGVSIFAHSGQELGKITPPPPSLGEEGTCGAAIEQTTGALYVSEPSPDLILRLVLRPGATAPYSYSSFDVTSIVSTEINPCHLATDRNGHVYAFQYGEVRRFEASDFATGEPRVAGTPFAASATAISVDQATGDVFIDTGGAIQQYSEAGTLKDEFGQGVLTGSSGVAVAPSSDRVLATTAGRVVSFKYGAPRYQPIDNPAVLHAVKDSAHHNWADIQLTPDGRYAAFSTSQPLTGFTESYGHLEVYRYDSTAASGDGLLCLSCSPGNERTLADAGLAEHGLSLLSDGRVFFDTTSQLVLRDTNSRQDAYEYENGSTRLISSGVGAFDAGLLTATTDGRDAYFFGHEALAPGDGNGSSVRIYDAREGGGFFVVAQGPPCAASDECHGPGSPAPAPPQIGSRAARAPVMRCGKGKVRRKGKCVKRHRHKKGKHGHRKGGAKGAKGKAKRG